MVRGWPKNITSVSRNEPISGMIKGMNAGLPAHQGLLDEGIEPVERGLSDDTCFLRVFLTCAPPWGAMQLRNDRAMPKIQAEVAPQLAFEEALDELAENIAQQFPVTFVIDDACLTNSRWIWTNRYFYL